MKIDVEHTKVGKEFSDINNGTIFSNNGRNLIKVYDSTSFAGSRYNAIEIGTGSVMRFEHDAIVHPAEHVKIKYGAVL